MLHDLLMALSGIPGDIFILTQDENIKLLDSLAYTHPCEAEILNSLCELGTAYFHLKKYVNSPAHLSSVGLESREVKGLYIRAFVSGLRNVLQPYNKALLKLEEDVLKYLPHVNLSYIQAELNEYRWLLSSLWRLIQEVSASQVHGCNILDVIHRHSMSGMPVVQSSMKKLQDACHGVMLNQLSSWLLYGMLVDPYGEFFIEEYKKPVQEKGSKTTLETAHQSSDSVLSEFANIQEDVQEDETRNLKFRLCCHMIPSYFPVHLAETILFVGESIKIFGGESGLKKYSGKDSCIFRGKQHEFSKELRELQQKELNLKTLETVVNSIRACVSEHLWTVVVEQANLYGHLRAVKDFFLLGRGELYLAFIDQAGHLLNVIPSLSTVHDINKGFCVAARSVLIDEETYFDKFSLSIDGISIGQHPEIQPFGTNTGANCWTCIRMNYKPPNPLDILFTPSLLDKYNMIFKFLLNIKRVQLELQRCWEIQMGAKKKRFSYENVQQWHLRTCMAFLIDNIQYYLQVDVLDGQFSILTEKVKGTRDFEQIQVAHRVFVNDVSANTFVLMKPVFHSIQDFMKFCLSYCTALKNTPSMSASDLKVFQKEFHQYSALLFHVLSGASGHQAGPHLAQLLIRLDFNKYFSTVQRAF